MNGDIPRARLSRTGRLLGGLAGLLLLPLGLGLGFLTYVLLFDKEPPGPSILALAGVTFLATFWILNLSRRLILGRPFPDGGLFSPLELRVIACFIIALPAIALLTGSWRQKSDGSVQSLAFVLQSVFYILIAFRLFRIASSRKTRSDNENVERHTSVEPPS